MNDEDFADANLDYIYKIWPTSVDQEAFRLAMTNGQATKGFEDALIVQAHEFFKQQVLHWLTEAADQEELRAQGVGDDPDGAPGDGRDRPELGR